MFAFVTAPGTVADEASPDVLLTVDQAADLVGHTSFGAGLSVAVDLGHPQRWHAVSVTRWEEADLVLLDALIGPDAGQRLDQVRSGATSNGPIDVKPSTSWLRVAVINALDRWLQLPLDQALLDAERAVALGAAAATLPSGPLRERRLGQALVTARLAGDGLATYLATLAKSARSLPPALFSGLERLANGYAALGREVRDGPERQLAAVATAWAQLQAHGLVADRYAPDQAEDAGPVGSWHQPAADGAALTSHVDPRQLRARLVGFDQAATEIRMKAVDRDGCPAVRVTVPAFSDDLSASAVTDRLLVRLVDRRSGDVHEPALLELVTGRHVDQHGSKVPVFTRVVPLRGVAPEDLRADVFDADSEVAPAPTDTDAGLVRGRRAATVLREWRLAAAEATLTGDLAARDRRLARLVDILAPAVADPDDPVFHGGPTLTQLIALIEPTSSMALEAAAAQAWAATTLGPGESLVAELAAARRAG